MIKGVVLTLVALVVVAAGAALLMSARGISAKAEPGPIETALARTMRRLAIPRDARERRNPVARTAAVVNEGMAHWADHCAACHGNDGGGDTEMGRGLYPKAPDMRLAATQSMSDGELFYIIEHGVRLTGMPAWSTGHADGETSTWHLVHFIRELPRLTPAQIEAMKEMNPRSPAEIRQEIEEEKFLRGDDVAPDDAPAESHTHTGAHE